MSNHVFQLADGRRLSYHQLGSDDGLPVIAFHGWGGSRLTMHPDESIIEQLGIRLVTVDRPGVGYSDLSPGNTLLSWAKDITALADHLSIEKLSLLGHSAGAPYALACAHHMGERVISVAIVSGLGPHIPSARLFTLNAKAIASLFRSESRLLRLLFSMGRTVLTSQVVCYLYQNFTTPFTSDREAMISPAMKAMRIRSLREAFRQGIDGIYQDASVVLRPDWGFSVSEIVSPVRIWHGESDAIVGVEFGKELSALLSNSVLMLYPKPGHHLLYILWREIFEKIKEDSEAR